MNTEKPEIDVNLKFVRLIERRPDGFVEFEFAIGEPDLCVELLLPEEGFRQFCRSNAVQFLPPREATGSDWEWGLREATRQRFR
ncbi:phenol hydroxylase [Pseudothauera nasutitermitis]|uniref:Phenol hydroxylase n=1 Tax=Pseudothauera nasutitermitis TaxID=2565930 RepID=A0A4V3WB49_9RHOO|nr:phenol hydroxylase subunit [Pseudothauera nasutitermitis]THF61862.1 phenol hydroxylase [Pseudothauera nasutitermitis]